MKKDIKNILLEEGFRPFSEISYEEYLPYQERITCCNLTYVTLFAYDPYYPYFIKITENGLLLSGEGIDTDFEAYCVIISLQDEKLFPLYEEAVSLFQRLSLSVSLIAMDERYAKMLESHPLTESIHYTEDDSDYVYDIAEFLNLEGGKNAKKRRDINKTTTTYDNIQIRTIRDFKTEKATILQIIDKWCDDYDCEKCMYGCEKVMIENILNSDLVKRLYGAIMYIDDKPEMFAISQIIGDTCYLYFKKSTDRLAGTFYYFEYHFLQPVKNLKYVNFEEDMGLPGLREYKRRRHPAFMVNKYEVRIKGMVPKENPSTALLEAAEKSSESSPDTPSPSTDISEKMQQKPAETSEKTVGIPEKASENDRPFLLQLWQEAFEDSTDYINRFLDFHLSENSRTEAFLWKENGRPVTMLFALSAKISVSGRKTQARYLYAIATKKAYRGHKFLQKILPALKHLFGDDCILFLVPEKEVIPYYESLGFTLHQGLSAFSAQLPYPPGDFSGTNFHTPPQDASSSLLYSLERLSDPSLYHEIRDSHLKNRDCVLWEEPEIAWALTSLSFFGGKAYLLNCCYGKHLLAGYLSKQELLQEDIVSNSDYPSKQAPMQEDIVPNSESVEIKNSDEFQIIETTLSKEELTALAPEILSALHCTKLSQKQLCYMTDSKTYTDALYLSLALND